MFAKRHPLRSIKEVVSIERLTQTISPLNVTF